MTHATDIVAYTYNADIYCPPCVHKMLDLAPDLDTEAGLELRAKRTGIDYSDPYSYDSDNFPKVVFSSQANDADYDHCGNMSNPKFSDICDGHIDHEEWDCKKWRGIEETDDFSGRFIIWTSSDNQFVLEMTRVYPPTKPDEHGKDQWAYKLFDYTWQDHTGPEDRLFDPGKRDICVPLFSGDEFWSPNFNDAPEIVAGILGFLSLEPGDTDSEYFSNYTNMQINWRNARASDLKLVAMEQFEEL